MRTGKAIGTIAAIVLALIFGVTLLLGILTGASVYSRVTERVDNAAARRVGLTYITAKIKSFDADNAVRVAPFGDGDALFLIEEFDGIRYEDILYVYGGELMELYCEEGYESDPAFGERIAEAKSLKASESGGLLTIEYEDGSGNSLTANVYLRSGGVIE